MGTSCKKAVKLNYFFKIAQLNENKVVKLISTDFQLFHTHKFCNPNNSTKEALTHAAFHKPPKHHQIQFITVKQCQPVPSSK